MKKSFRRQSAGPKFVRYFDPVIQALKELGGSGRTSEVIELVAKIKGVPESEQQEVLKSGGLRFDNQVQFARQYLVWAGYLDGSKRGVWSLTETGWKVASISDSQALELFKKEHAAHTGISKEIQNSEHTVTLDGASGISSDEKETAFADLGIPEKKEKLPGHRELVLARLRKMTPKGFEHFCVRLLKEHGFEGLTNTGGPKDKGIDGAGTLRINPFVSFSVVFQSKRYAAASAVTSSQISEFRGSIPNSIDKGIFITTSDFTADARSISRDTDKKPIELISGDDIIDLMEKIGLGLKRTYKIEEEFFDSFTYE